VPFFFAGQNSRLFQLASHVSMTLRLSLLFKEVHDRIGSEIHVRIGEMVPFDKLQGINDRQSFMDHLKAMTYALGDDVPNPPKTRIKRPRGTPKQDRWIPPQANPSNPKSNKPDSSGR